MSDGCGQQQGQRPLWAPWRIDYIRGPKDGVCFLCDKGGRESTDDQVIFRGSTGFVLLNAFPYNSGHLLVAPYRHVATLSDLGVPERAEIMELMVRATEALARAMQPQGFNLGFNLGEVAGAGLAEHVHGHVVPRWGGDTNFMAALADTRVVPEALEATAALLRDTWR